MFKRFFIRFCIIVFNFFAIFNRSATKRNIVIIALTAFIAISTIIFYPCFLEAFNQTSREMPFKIMHSNFDSGIFFSQDRVNIQQAFRPFNGGWIKPFEFSINSISKFSRSIEITTDSVPTKANETTEKTCKYSEVPSVEMDIIIDNIIYQCILGLIIGLLVTAPLWLNRV